MSTLTRELHGITEETLRSYLIRLGGMAQPDGNVTGSDWMARVIRLPDYKLGRASFCSYRVEMAGDPQTLREIWQRFELMTMRPGG
jgi:hypothetical protein